MVGPAAKPLVDGNNGAVILLIPQEQIGNDGILSKITPQGFLIMFGTLFRYANLLNLSRDKVLY